MAYIYDIITDILKMFNQCLSSGLHKFVITVKKVKCRLSIRKFKNWISFQKKILFPPRLNQMQNLHIHFHLNSEY